MSRELGNGDLFITWPMNDKLCRKGAVQELCGVENTPKAQGQTSHSKIATIWRLVASYGTLTLNATYNGGIPNIH